MCLNSSRYHIHVEVQAGTVEKNIIKCHKFMMIYELGSCRDQKKLLRDRPLVKLVDVIQFILYCCYKGLFI